MLRTRFKIRGGAGVLRGNKVERIFGIQNFINWWWNCRGNKRLGCKTGRYLMYFENL